MNLVRLLLIVPVLSFYAKVEAGSYQIIENNTMVFQSQDFNEEINSFKDPVVLSTSSASVANELTKNYSTVVENCGTQGRPAFLCSGVMIRATDMSTNFHSWDPSPRSIKAGGVSFSYLRKDIPFKRLVHDKKSGIIYYPSMLKPEGKGRAEVLCSFPLDGWTDGRNGNGGCGEHKEFVGTSKECQSQGILKAEVWFTHFTSVPAEDNKRLKHQCGFNVGVKTPNSAQIFNESVKSQQKAAEKDYPNKQNELVIATWPTDTQGKILEPQKLPIQAFFYIDDIGKEEARYYQRDYYNTTQIVIPIVKVDFSDAAGDVKFIYEEAAQQKVKCRIKSPYYE